MATGCPVQPLPRLLNVYHIFQTTGTWPYIYLACVKPTILTEHLLLHLLEKSWRQIFSPTGPPSQRAALDLGKLREGNVFMELLKEQCIDDKV